MDEASLLEVVTELIQRLGVDLRRERLGGDGGNLCRIRGKNVLFDDLDSDIATRVDRCISALADLPEAASIYMPPEIRERVEKYRT